VLFHLPALRKAVFSIDTSSEDAPASPGTDGPASGRDRPAWGEATVAPTVALALQRLMCRLQILHETEQEETRAHAPVSATQLIASFGWDSDDIQTQQDVGELVTVLLDTLEEGMKGSSAAGEITRLFSLSCVYEDTIHQPSSEVPYRLLKYICII